MINRTILIINHRSILLKIYVDDIWYTKKDWTGLENNKNEKGLFDTIDKYARKDICFIDLGAAVGWVSLYASFKFKNIIALEPNKDVLYFLKKNIKLNKIKNIHVLHGCINTHNKIIKFDHGPNFNDICFTKSTKGYNVKSYTIKKLLTLVQNKKVFIKIDIEGYEFNLLNDKKFINEIKILKPMIFISLHHGMSSFAKYKKSRFKYLKKLYNLFKILQEYILILKLFQIYNKVYLNNKKISFLFFLNPKYWRKNVNIFFHN